MKRTHGHESDGIAQMTYKNRTNYPLTQFRVVFILRVHVVVRNGFVLHGIHLALMWQSNLQKKHKKINRAPHVI